MLYGIINILSLDEVHFGWLVVVLQNYFIVVVLEDLWQAYCATKVWRNCLHWHILLEIRKYAFD